MCEVVNTQLELSLKIAEQLSLDAMKYVAQNIESFEAGLSIPEDDLTEFFLRLPHGSVLDAGCGPGRYADRFAQYTYLGIDNSPELLEIARERNPALSFQTMNYLALELANDSVDGIWGCSIFGTSPKVLLFDALTEFLRVLKPGGLLYLVVPDAGVSLDELRTISFGHGIMHVAFWEPMEFAKVAGSVGFSDMQVIQRPEHNVASFILVK